MKEIETATAKESRAAKMVAISRHLSEGEQDFVRLKLMANFYRDWHKKTQDRKYWSKLCQRRVPMAMAYFGGFAAIITGIVVGAEKGLMLGVIWALYTGLIVAGYTAATAAIIVLSAWLFGPFWARIFDKMAERAFHYEEVVIPLPAAEVFKMSESAMAATRGMRVFECDQKHGIIHAAIDNSWFQAASEVSVTVDPVDTKSTRVKLTSGWRREIIRSYTVDSNRRHVEDLIKKLEDSAITHSILIDSASDVRPPIAPAAD
jgi:hypothetical protein